MKHLSSSFAVKLSALLVFGMGVTNILSALFARNPFRNRLIADFLSLDLRLGTRSLTVVAGFLLILLAWNLYKKKHLAFIIVLSLLQISAVFHLLKGLDFEEAFAAEIITLFLILNRKHFFAKSSFPSPKTAVSVLLYTFVFCVVYGVIGFLIMRHQYRPHPTFVNSLYSTLSLIFFQDSLLLPLSRRALWFEDTISIVSFGGVLTFISYLFRPYVLRDNVSGMVKMTVRSLVQQYGNSSIAYFVLMNDKKYFIEEEEECVVGYGVIDDIAISCGDPIGPSSVLEKTISDFSMYCAQNSWSPSFYQVKKENLPLYKKLNFNAVVVGSDALINLKTFSVSGGKKSDLRTAENRAKREGWHFGIANRFTPLHITAQCEEISKQWLDKKFGGEMGFAMDGTSVKGDGLTYTAYVTDSTGTVMAFCTWAPVPAVHGWSLDLMRRREDVPNGTMEFLILQSLLYFKARGDKCISLGLAPFISKAQESSESNITHKALHFIYSRLNVFYNYEGLYKFKSKFEPEWEERYLIYPNSLVLPKIIFVLIRLQMPHLSLQELHKVIST